MNSISKHLLDGDLYKKYFDFHILSFFMAVNQGFIIHIDFSSIVASNTATDDVTN